MKKKLLILSVIAATLFTTNGYAYITVNSPKWIQENNEWRLIDTGTGMMVYTDIAYVGLNDTYIFENGYMVHDRWITMYNKYQYYCGSDGRVLKKLSLPMAMKWIVRDDISKMDSQYKMNPMFPRSFTLESVLMSI